MAISLMLHADGVADRLGDSQYLKVIGIPIATPQPPIDPKFAPMQQNSEARLE
jgi:hypothetical protein